MSINLRASCNTQLVDQWIIHTQKFINPFWSYQCDFLIHWSRGLVGYGIYLVWNLFVYQTWKENKHEKKMHAVQDSTGQTCWLARFLVAPNVAFRGGTDCELLSSWRKFHQSIQQTDRNIHTTTSAMNHWYLALELKPRLQVSLLTNTSYTAVYYRVDIVLPCHQYFVEGLWMVPSCFTKVHISYLCRFLAAGIQHLALFSSEKQDTQNTSPKNDPIPSTRKHVVISCMEGMVG